MINNNHLSNKILINQLNLFFFYQKTEIIYKNPRKKNHVDAIMITLALISIFTSLTLSLYMPSNVETPYVPVLEAKIAQDVFVLREAFTPNGGIVITVHDQYGKLNDFSIA